MENLRKRLNRKAKGFTLVELLVVIAIIAILSVTAYVALGGQTGKARDSRRQSDVSAIQSALELYFINNNSRYPLALTDLTDVEMPELPTDPWSDDVTTYDYLYDVDLPGRKEYELAATLENEDGVFEAYVIGNGSGLLTSGNEQDGTPCALVVDGGDCLPYYLP